MLQALLIGESRDSGVLNSGSGQITQGNFILVLASRSLFGYHFAQFREVGGWGDQALFYRVV